MTEAGTNIGSGGGAAPLPRAPAGAPRVPRPEERLERLHAYFLEGCTDEIRPVLESVLADARRVHAGYADDEVGDGLASVWYAATAMVELGAALELDEADVRGAGAVIAEACAFPPLPGMCCSVRSSGTLEAARASPAHGNRAPARTAARPRRARRRDTVGADGPRDSIASSCSAATVGRVVARAPRRRRPSAALAAVAPRRITAPVGHGAPLR